MSILKCNGGFAPSLIETGLNKNSFAANYVQNKCIQNGIYYLFEFCFLTDNNYESVNIHTITVNVMDFYLSSIQPFPGRAFLK